MNEQCPGGSGGIVSIHFLKDENDVPGPHNKIEYGPEVENLLRCRIKFDCPAETEAIAQMQSLLKGKIIHHHSPPPDNG